MANIVILFICLDQLVERAWLLLRQHVMELAYKKRKERSLNWTVLKHTLDSLRQGDRARQELYRKYLQQEDPYAWCEGLECQTIDVKKLITSRASASAPLRQKVQSVRSATVSSKPRLTSSESFQK